MQTVMAVIHRMRMRTRVLACSMVLPIKLYINIYKLPYFAHIHSYNSTAHSSSFCFAASCCHYPHILADMCDCGTCSLLPLLPLFRCRILSFQSFIYTFLLLNDIEETLNVFNNNYLMYVLSCLSSLVGVVDDVPQWQWPYMCIAVCTIMPLGCRWVLSWLSFAQMGVVTVVRVGVSLRVAGRQHRLRSSLCFCRDADGCCHPHHHWCSTAVVVTRHRTSAGCTSLSLSSWQCRSAWSSLSLWVSMIVVVVGVWSKLWKH